MRSYQFHASDSIRASIHWSQAEESRGRLHCLLCSTKSKNSKEKAQSIAEAFYLCGEQRDQCFADILLQNSTSEAVVAKKLCTGDTDALVIMKNFTVKYVIIRCSDEIATTDLNYR